MGRGRERQKCNVDYLKFGNNNSLKLINLVIICDNVRCFVNQSYTCKSQQFCNFYYYLLY